MKSQPQSANGKDFGQTPRQSVTNRTTEESDSGQKAARQLQGPTSALPTDRFRRKSASTSPSRPVDYEVLTSAELARRLKVKESWVVDQSKRSRTHNPIPVFRLGKHRRYRWGSPELNAWLDRRAGYNTTTRKAGSQKNGGTIS